MNWLLESTVERNLLLIGLAAAAVVLLTIWVRTGKRFALPSALLTAVLLVAVLAASHFIVTPREAVEATLHRIAAAVENNDLRTVLGHIHSSRSDIAARARSEMPKYRFESVRITGVDEITTDVSRQPATAQAKFYLHATGNFGPGSEVYAEQGVRRLVILDFEEENGVWKVVDYQHYSPLAEFGGQP